MPAIKKQQQTDFRLSYSPKIDHRGKLTQVARMLGELTAIDTGVSFLV